MPKFKRSIKEGANCKTDLDQWVRIVPNMILEVTNAVHNGPAVN